MNSKKAKNTRKMAEKGYDTLTPKEKKEVSLRDFYQECKNIIKRRELC
jgi:hypothetical protein